nr:reverse transcriptase domain-containing protein [Tanacetum cinerariifolium]
MQKNLALIAKYFKKIYKPTNNNLRTSSNSKNKNVDTIPRYKNDDHSGQFGNQRTVNVVAARENVGSKVVQQSGIQCFNCREFGHFAKECRKPKRVKNSAYHKEKMLLCKQAEQGIPLQAEQYDWLEDTVEEVDEQELEAHYIYMAKIQEDDILNEQNVVESDDEHVALANLNTNLKLAVDENKKIQKQLKKANTTLTQELKECKTILVETRNEFYCFFDGFSGYIQIPINPPDQVKTTFTYPYGTFAYRRMPFGLCNAPVTFQRCMMAIFHDMIEKTIEVFMDDFSVFGDSFSSCLMLQRCEDTNLVLNWEKCHFMVKEGIVLGHKISKNRLEVDRAKVDVIAKLPHPTTMKGVRSFLGHAGFYQRFIQDYSKIARPMTHLLEK